MTFKHATTSAPIMPTLVERWSPRSFDTEFALPDETLRSLFEAARWSPSAGNSQPWRYILARRGSEAFAKIETALTGRNKDWAGAASALVVNIAITEDSEGNQMRWAEYDLGQAVAHLSLQAHNDGLYVHQMGGFNVDELREAFALEDRFTPVSVMTIGKLGAPEQLPDELKDRELAPRTRTPLGELLIVNS